MKGFWKGLFASVVLAFFILLLFRGFTTENEVTQKLSSAPSASAKASPQVAEAFSSIQKTLTDPVKRSIRTTTVPIKSKQGGERNSLTDQGYVEFRIENGLAIAYGDVVLGKPDPNFSERKGVTEARPPELWKTRNIPYLISPQLPNPDRVEKALNYLRKKTAVRFTPHQGEPDALIFEPGEKHCYSYLGRIHGLQPVSLSAQCKWNEILHEVLHALGFVHEQSRPDRDQFIEIVWDNIDEEYQGQFDKVPEAWTETLRGSGFDFRSVMLYRPNSFAKDKSQATLRSKSQATIAPVEEGLSSEDIARVNRVYGLYE